MRKYLINWVLLNGSMLGIMYYGLVQENIVALIVVIGWAWLMGIAGALALLDPTIYHKILVATIKNRKNGIYDYMTRITLVDAIYDIVVILFFIKFGFILTGIVYFLHMYVLQKMLLQMKQMRSQ